MRKEYKNDQGQYHREDGRPAITHPNGTQYWWINGQLHRIDGPAIIYPDETQAWCLNGKWHRIDGPAIIRPDGYQAWYLNGKRHRIDGPAVIRPDGTQYWYINGKKLTKNQVLIAKRMLADPAWTGIPMYLSDPELSLVIERIYK